MLALNHLLCLRVNNLRNNAQRLHKESKVTLHTFRVPYNNRTSQISMNSLLVLMSMRLKILLWTVTTKLISQILLSHKAKQDKMQDMKAQ